MFEIEVDLVASDDGDLKFGRAGLMNSLDRIRVLAVSVAMAMQACASSSPYSLQQAARMSSTAAQVRQTLPATTYCDFGGFSYTDLLIVRSVSQKYRKLGIQLNDRITSFDRDPINSLAEMLPRLLRHRPGDTITLGLDRSGRSVDVPVICEDGFLFRTSILAALDAGARHDWRTCVQQIAQVESIAVANAETRLLRMMCNESARMDRNIPPSTGDALIVFESTESTIRDAPFTSGGVDAQIGIATQNINWLRANGFAALADDLSKTLIVASSTELPPIDQHAEQPERVSGSGSGFVVAAHTVLTNAHVVANCRALKVNDLEAFLLRVDETNDLAILHVEGLSAPALQFRPGKDLQAGEPIVALGFPLPEVLSSDAKVTTGSISATSGPANDIRLIQISAPVQPGNSGGPLLDEGGSVVGVVSSKLDALFIASIIGDIPQNVNFAIKSGIARLFLDAAGVTYSMSYGTRGLSTPEIVTRANRSVVRVVCE